MTSAPIDLLFAALASLTGGIIDDVTSAMLGLIVLSGLMMGLDILLTLLQSWEGNRVKKGKLKLAIEEQDYNYQRFQELHEILGKKGHADDAYAEAEYEKLRRTAGDMPLLDLGVTPEQLQGWRAEISQKKLAKEKKKKKKK